MTFTDIFVRRPVLALVVSTLIFMFGLRAIFALPIRQYPLTESSTITITTQYPGASPDLMQGFVTQPIAQSVATIEGIDYLSSSSTQGRSVIAVRMKLNVDSTRALTEVMAKTNQVKYRLPREAYDPVIARSTGEAVAVAYVGFATTSLSVPALTDYLMRVVQPQLASIDGVSNTELQGAQTLAMRVWLDPARMAARGIAAGEIADALRQNNVQAAPGQTKGLYVVSNIAINTDLVSVDDFRNMGVRQDGDTLIRLADVATVELGAASYDSSARMDGLPTVYFGLWPTPSGNPLTIVARLKELLPDIERNLPPGITVAVPFELARFIRASIHEVARTLIEAVAIVVVVIFLCLGSPRAVAIPVVTIPLSMFGAAAIMLAAGFSLNLLTLLAMVLAIGLVVDDAIVVVENVHRHMEGGRPPLQAALVGAREVAAPVIAMTITLAAVYAPIGLMGGLTGALFKEFAFTLAGSVVVSGVIALTLSPVMSAALLTSRSAEGRMARLAEAAFDRLKAWYGRALDLSLHHRWVTGIVAGVILISLPLLYGRAQHELAPIEDQADVTTAIKSPQYANIDYVETFADKWDRTLAAIPEVESRWLINGIDGPANSIGGANLRDWKARQRNADEIQVAIQAAMNDVEGSSVFAFQLPALPGSTGGLPVQMVLRSAADYRVVYDAMEQLKAAARASGLFAVVDSDLEFNNPVVKVQVDRAKANSVGVTMKAIGDTLAVLVGENYVNRFALDGRSYDVIPQAPRGQRMTPESLAQYYVKAGDGTQVALSTLVRVAVGVEPNRLTQFNQLNAATLQAIPMPGVTVGDAVQFLRAQAAQLPTGFTYDWQSDARQYTQEGSALMISFLFAIIVIYLVLAAQYESLRDPLIILISVPMSMCGALAPLALGMATLNIYTQIGLVTLIGLISKHGILMVEFANELQASHGLDRRAAIEQAGRIRLRPILMTTAAMVVGLVPLLFASGAGAKSRFGLGVVIVTGMLVGTLFTLFVLPTMYTLVARDHRQMGEIDASPEGPDEGPSERPRAGGRTLAVTATLLLIAVAASGCAVGPKYVAPQVTPVALVSAEQSLFASDAVQQDWWRQLDDPALDALIDRALRENHDIRLAQARLREARAVFDERQFDRVPEVTAGAQLARTDAQTNTGVAGQRLVDTYRAGFDAAWEIDLFGRLQRLAQAASARAEASAADLAHTRVTVVAELARQYYEMRGAERQLAVTRANLENQRSTVRITAALVDAGRGDPGDLASARANVALTEAVVPPLETRRRLAAYRVAVLAGARPGDLAVVAGGLPRRPLAARLPIGDVGTLLQRRPDVHAAERQLAAATADIGAATARLYPRIDVGGFLGLIAVRGADLGSAGAYSLLPSVGWPVSRFGGVKAQVRAAKARSEGAAAFYEQVMLTAVEDVEGALTSFGQTQARVRQLIEAARQGQIAVDLARVRYREGASPFLVVLDAERALLDAQDALAQAETASYVDLIAVYKAVGGGWTP